jgi:trans-aconitate 2-methyltransferase
VKAADWDAGRYHQLSEPQYAWGLAVLERLDPRAGERILDVGCGTGRLTRLLAARMQQGHIVGLDRSSAMLEVAARASGPAAGAASVAFLQGDAGHLPFGSAFDAVFSTATYHWVGDHDAAFASAFAALKPGGRFVAQCGGGPNLRRLLDRAHELMASPPYNAHFASWTDPWVFAGPEETRERLLRAGFTDVGTSLEDAPADLRTEDNFTEFISCVCVRHHVDRLPADLRPRFARALAQQAGGDDPPYVLDYWRLNMSGRRPA